MAAATGAAQADVTISLVAAGSVVVTAIMPGAAGGSLVAQVVAVTIASGLYIGSILRCRADIEPTASLSLRGGRFGYRHAHTRAMHILSAMPT